jgi:hypothetical protein
LSHSDCSSCLVGPAALVLDFLAACTEQLRRSAGRIRLTQQDWRVTLCWEMRT